MKRKDLIQALNIVAKTNFEVAQAILDELNGHWGTDYGWLNKRVVIFDSPNSTVAERYAHCHDAECCINE